MLLRMGVPRENLNLLSLSLFQLNLVGIISGIDSGAEVASAVCACSTCAATFTLH